DLRADLQRLRRELASSGSHASAPSSSGRMAVPPALHNWKMYAAAGAILALLAALLLIRFGVVSKPQRSDEAQLVDVSSLKITPFTTFKGQEIAPTFSPDGNEIVFAWDGGEGTQG